MTQNQEPLSLLAQSILRGLEELAAYARGDESRVRITQVPPPADSKPTLRRTGQINKPSDQSLSSDYWIVEKTGKISKKGRQDHKNPTPSHTKKTNTF